MLKSMKLFRMMYVRVQRLNLHIPGHANTNTTRATYITTTTTARFNTCATNTTTAATSFLCEWFISIVGGVVSWRDGAAALVV